MFSSKTKSKFIHFRKTPTELNSEMNTNTFFQTHSNQTLYRYQLLLKQRYLVGRWRIKSLQNRQYSDFTLLSTKYNFTHSLFKQNFRFFSIIITY